MCCTQQIRKGTGSATADRAGSRKLCSKLVREAQGREQKSKAATWTREGD